MVVIQRRIQGCRPRVWAAGWPWGVALTLILGLSSCGHIITKRSSYRGEEGVEVNSALVRSAVKPVGGESDFNFSALVYTAGAGTLTGPFLWRIEAYGDDGYHRELTVHRIKVTTRTTEREEWYPEELLGEPVEFFPVKGEPGEAFAQYQIPGKLEVFPDEDGPITILVDLTVRSVEKPVRKIVRFRMAPQKSRDLELLFLPGDIVRRPAGKDPQAWRW